MCPCPQEPRLVIRSICLHPDCLAPTPPTCLFVFDSVLRVPLLWLLALRDIRKRPGRTHSAGVPGSAILQAWESVTCRQSASRRDRGHGLFSLVTYASGVLVRESSLSPKVTGTCSCILKVNLAISLPPSRTDLIWHFYLAVYNAHPHFWPKLSGQKPFVLIF